MPLWDNFARSAEALPVASVHGADDFVPMWDASAGVVTRTAAQNLRSREIFALPMYVSQNAGPVSSTTGPLRVIRTPYAFTLTSVVATCTASPTISGQSVGFDVHAGGASVFTGSSVAPPVANLTLSSSGTTGAGLRTAISSFSGNSSLAIASDTELRFWSLSANAEFRQCIISLLGYRT